MWNWLRRKPALQPIAGTVPNLIRESLERTQYTPDIAELEQFNHHLLFVPDDLQVGMRKHHLLKDATNLRIMAFTQHDHVMLKHDLAEMSYPIIFRENLFNILRVPEKPIKGSLFSIPPSLFCSLDTAKMNGVQFYRERVMVVIPYERIWFKEKKDLDIIVGNQPQNRETFEYRAKRREGVLSQSRFIRKYGMMRVWPWIYYGEPSYWKDILNNMEHPPVTTYTDDGVIKEYYHFNHRELGPPF